MRARDGAVVAVGVFALAIGGLQAVAPRSIQEIEQQRSDRQVQDLGDANEQHNDRLRRSGDNLQDAERGRQQIPHEPRPPVPPAGRIKLWWLP